MYAYVQGKNIRFSVNLMCLVFLLPPFLDSPFCVTTDKLMLHSGDFHTLGSCLSYYPKHHFACFEKNLKLNEKKTTKHKIIFFSDGDIRLARVNFVQIYN